jgi:uncharacterized paraquat-inducible protein A
MKNNILKIFFLLLLSAFLIPFVVNAQPVSITISNPITASSFDQLVEGVISFIFTIATAVFPLMIVIGAFYFLTAAGNPQQIQTAKTIILYTIIGYAIILISRGLIYIVRNIILGGTP